jgi:hydroxyethylthiazole kinase-like uncharacterized protein yjeF
MGAADRAAIRGGVSGLRLMEAAGRAVAEEACDMTPGFGRVAVLCGPGNNGGDGFVAARYLARRGRRVRLALLGDRSKLTGDAGEMARRWTGGVEALGPKVLKGADLVVDALFGAGLTRGIDENGPVGRVLAEIAARGVPVLAVDLPSGLNGDDGQVAGAAVKANRTVTFFRRKPGHLLLPGRQLCGIVRVADIGIPADVLDGIAGTDGALTFANDPRLWLAAWRWPASLGHKYAHGHAVVVSGGAGKAGAARLAGEAAIRIGAGLVTLALPPEIAAQLGGQVKAVMQHAGQTAEALGDLLSDDRKNAVVIGPGLGLDDEAFARVMAVLGSAANVVLDADAVTLAARDPAAVFSAIQSGARRNTGGRGVVLTPHEGEFKRLFPDVTGSKLERARQAAVRSGAVVVLKGGDTVIAAPDRRAAINENAPATLATAGTGDVLSGITGGLLARRMPAFEAAAAAVWCHGAAGEVIGPGLIADDIIAALPSVIGELAATRF